MPRVACVTVYIGLVISVADYLRPFSSVNRYKKSLTISEYLIHTLFWGSITITLSGDASLQSSYFLLIIFKILCC